MLSSLLATPNYLSWILIGVLVVVLVVSMILMNRRSKKREADAQALINAIKPGNKVKTIGGICGIVVEVNPEEDTFVLETGSEESGKSYMKFVRQAILESDAVIEKPEVKKEEAPAIEESTAVDSNADESIEALGIVDLPEDEEVPHVEEAPAEEAPAEEAPAAAEVKPKKTTRKKKAE